MTQSMEHAISARPIERPIELIAPATRRVRLSQVWTSMPLARRLAIRDFKARYKQSALGPL